MKSRKNKSILRGESKSRWSSPKGQTALALAILLWIAGGSVVALAQETIVASDYDGSVYGNHNDNGWNNYAGDPNNNQVTVNAGVTVSRTVCGSYKYATTVSGNTVIINGEVTSNVYGGNSGGDTAQPSDVHNNHVTITGKVGGDVYGGRCGDEGDASGNEVTVSGGTVGGNVYGGYVYRGDAAILTSNQVTLNGATVTGSVYGFSFGDGMCTKINDNTLNLSGANTVDGSVKNFNTIKLMDTLTWNATDPVLTAGSFENYGTLDITAATKLANQTEPSTMTLLSSDTDNNFNTIKLSYNTATQTNPVTLNSSKTSQVVKTVTGGSSADKGVTLGYNSTHTVSLDAANSYKNVNYTIANNVNAIIFGSMNWEDSRSMAASSYDFSNVSTISAKNLVFAFDDSQKYMLKKDEKMTLLANAKNLASGKTVTDANISQEINYSMNNGAALTGTLSGTVSTEAVMVGIGKVDFKVTGMTLDAIDLSKWDSNKVASYVPEGWTAKEGGVAVTAAGFDASGIAVGTTDIVTTNTEDFFSDDKITGALKYAENISVTDSGNGEGVTLTGTESKGVKAADTGRNLVYERSKFNVSNISLGEMTWGTGRNGTGYDFTNLATIDATKLHFNFTDEEQKKALAANSSRTPLLSSVNYNIDPALIPASHTQTVNYTTVDGCALTGTLKGDFGLSGNKTTSITYQVSSMTLDSVNVTGWTGDKDADSVPAGWTAKTGGIDITADSTFAPKVSADSEKTILSATAGYFSNANIADALKYKADTASSDTEKGITLTGAESKGVKASDDGKNLVYARSNFNVSNISLGEITWDGGRTASTGYDYSAVTSSVIDGSKLSFKNPENIGANASTTLLTANKTLIDGLSLTGFTANYSCAPVAGVTVAGQLTGSVASSEGKLVYTNTANKATKLTFDNVEWKDIGALIAHATDATKNISFDGADVDTTNITFTNIKTIEDNKQMTLVSDFGKAVGTISGTQFGIGTEKGEGHAFYENNNLRYLVTKGIGNSQASSGESVSGQTETVENGAKVNNSVIGAMTDSGKAEESKAIVSGGSEVTGNVIGAETESGLVNRNEASVTGESKINGNVEAAQTKSGNATANITNVENSNVTGSAVGAVTDSGVATGNVSNVSGGSVGGDVAGATSTSGTVSNGNAAKVQSAVVDGNVYGGRSTDGEVNTNTANVSGGSVQGSVYGGRTDGEKKADGNEVKLENDAKVQQDVYGGYSQQGTATGNTVKVDGASVEGTVYGGKSEDKSDKNSVELDKGTVGAIVGGGCEEASGNTVTITGGEVVNGVYGAKAGSSATNNTIIMAGGKVNNVLYGGYTESATGATTGNTVTLYGTADVSNASIFGGNGRDITGNTLNIGAVINDVATSWTGGGQSVKNIASFETMNFVAVPWSSTKAAVTISDGTSTDLSATKVNASKVYFTDTTSLNNGDTMTLLDEQTVAADKRVQGANLTTESQYTAGSTLKGTGTLSLDDQGNVLYTVTGKEVSNQSHNTVMGAAASVAALFSGNDFITGAADGLALASNTGADGMATYANVGGSTMRQETGSHVNAHLWNAILAVGHKNEKTKADFEYGAFLEYGTGNYSTHNGDERGDGSTKYTGGGLLAKYSLKNGAYVEGSLRGGRIHDDATNLLRDEAHNPCSYTANANYWGFHLGVGRELALDDKHTLDLYGKYFYNRRGSVSFNAGGHYDLDAVSSKVLRLGGKYTMQAGENWKWYGGLAYEHELGGAATGRADGMAIRGADIGGGSVRGELGATMQQAGSPWSLDLHVTGFAGKKQGLSGGVSVKYSF